MIILEGVDNTGKSTLLGHLISIFPMLTPQRMDNAPSATDDEYRDYLWGILAQSKSATQFMIFDRLLFSEMIYGPAVRGRMRLREPEAVAATKILKYHKPLIIHCRRTEAQIRSTFGEREQMSGVEERIADIVNGYEVYLGSHGLKNYVMRYDFENPKGLTLAVIAVADYIRRSYGIYGYDGELTNLEEEMN